MSQGPGGKPAASSGEPLPTRPEDTFAADLDQGAILVLPGPALSQNTQLLGPFVTQLRLAQERERLIEEAATAGAPARTDAPHTTLLESVAHDLRTPLAAIKASATVLLSLRHGVAAGGHPQALHHHRHRVGPPDPPHRQPA
ncbi:hypothetical protein [Streptomyces scopuliridis]|uniref:hypothetical protein n=1 Tax=Streptomyces scopuliridis TaxID=452529 RepID=UPI0036B388FD